jgi:uncharacterized protein
MNKGYTEHFAEKRFDQNLLWLKDNIVLESVMGSHAYGCNNDNSDYDVVGIVMDKHEHLYPQSYGYVLGFDNVPKFQNHECKGKEKRIVLSDDKELEGAWHSLTNFFSLVQNGSPNLTEVLFVRRNLVTFAHNVGWMLRDNRKLFLSVKMFHSFKGFCWQQFTRLQREHVRWNKEHKCDNSNRVELYENFGYDTKMSYHCLRLLDLVHQLLTEGDLDLMRNNEECKAMRKGEWGNWDKFAAHVERKLTELETLMTSVTVAVPNKPQTGALHELLVKCLEEWYGSESNMIKQGTEYVSAKEVKDELVTMKSLMEEMKQLMLRPVHSAGEYANMNI